MEIKSLMVPMYALPVFGLSIWVIGQTCLKAKKNRSIFLTECVNIVGVATLVSFVLMMIGKNSGSQKVFVVAKIFVSSLAIIICLRVLFKKFQEKKKELESYEKSREVWVMKTIGRKSQY